VLLLKWWRLLEVLMLWEYKRRRQCHLLLLLL
jgi:hypothetical protein